MRFDGKRDLITGAASGIGRATALQMMREGAQVCGMDVSQDALQQTAQLARPGGNWKSVVTDVSDPAQVSGAVQQVLHDWGRIDVLVNVAGVISVYSVPEMPDAEWDRVLRINLFGTFYTCKAVVPGMVERRTGSIVNVASGKAFRGLRNGSHYAASKGGVISFTYSLADELEGSGVRVNAVVPGNTATPMTQALRASAGDKRTVRTPEAQPEDVGEVILFLASDASRLINGQAIGRVREPDKPR